MGQRVLVVMLVLHWRMRNHAMRIRMMVLERSAISVDSITGLRGDDAVCPAKDGMVGASPCVVVVR